MINKQRHAFTLIEMLVAVILLTLLLGVALFSFRQLLITFNHIKKSGLHDTFIYHELRSSIESMQHYVVEEYDRLNQPTKNLHFFFQGTEDSMLYITSNPNYSTSPALAQLLCIDDTLVYKEEKLYGPIDFRQPHFSSQAHRVVLYDALEACKFAYYAQNTPTTLQVQQHDTIPKFVNITLRKKEQNLDLFIAIKSDNNNSVNLNYDLLYDEG